MDEARDKLSAICTALLLVLAGVVHCKNWAMRDKSWAWSAGGQAALELVDRTDGRDTLVFPGEIVGSGAA